MVLTGCAAEEADDFVLLLVPQVWFASHGLERFDQGGPRPGLHPTKGRLTHLQDSDENSRLRSGHSGLQFLLFQVVTRSISKKVRRVLNKILRLTSCGTS